MTFTEMISSFLLTYDYITSGSAPGYRSDDIASFLNHSQDDFIKERMFGKEFQPPKFESNQKRVADLQSIIVPYTVLTLSSTGDFGEKKYTLPTSSPIFLYYVDSYSILTRTNYPLITAEKRIKNDFVDHNNFIKFTNSEINRTHFLHPACYVHGGLIEIIGDRFTTINNVYLSYIKRPTVITNTAGTSDLPVHTHQEIVELAVWKGLRALGDPRWQLATADQKLRVQ